MEGGDYILTDDKAPWSSWACACSTRIIGAELDTLRDQIAEEGIMGLLE